MNCWKLAYTPWGERCSALVLWGVIVQAVLCDGRRIDPTTVKLA